MSSNQQVKSMRGAVVAALLTTATALTAQISHIHISTIQTSNQAGEITAYDPASGRYFVTNPGNGRLDVFTASSNGQLSSVTSISLSGSPTSVAVNNGLVAVAVQGGDPQANGFVQFFDASSANAIGAPVVVGALPDMVTFTPNGQQVLTANEGQADEDTGLNNPEGSVSIIDVASRVVTTASFAPWNSQKSQLQAAGVRLSNVNGITLAQDVEPEYVAVNAAGTTAFVTLQENNAIAEIDIATATVSAIRPLGEKDHSLPGNGFDPSNQDGIAGNFQNFPILGLYMPDALTTFTVGGVEFLATANEGDSRDPYAGFEDETRGTILEDDFNLDTEDPSPETNLYTSTQLNSNALLGRLKFATSDYDIARGDTDQDGDVDQLYTFGSRSFTIWTTSGTKVFDSGDDFEREMLAQGLWQESRSDDKGPEPESITFGVVDSTPLLFVGLERTHAVLIYDVSAPQAPVLVDTIDVEGESGVGARRPEGLQFIPAADNATGEDLLAVTSELDGALSLFAIRPEASITVVGVGCPSAQPVILTSNTPRLGATWDLSASQIEQIAPFCFFWFGDQVYTHLVNLGALLGMTGCFSHCNGTLGAFSQTVTSNGSSSMAISVPNNPALLRFELSVQVTSASVQTNTGWSASNGLIGRIGN